MKSNKYILIVFFIGTPLSNSCSGDSFVGDIDIQFCGKCAGTGEWTVNVMDFNPCCKTNAACLDWAKKMDIQTRNVFYAIDKKQHKKSKGEY